MKIGIDIVEHHRFLENDKLIQKILSDREQQVYNKITNEKRQIEYLASRFASKEAIFKAYEQGDKTLNYKDISICNKANGAPFVMCDRLKDNILISISHSENYSIAMVIID